LKTNVDALFVGFAGTNTFRFLRQFNEYGLRGKVPVMGGYVALDEATLRNMGDEVVGMLTSSYYSAELANPINRKFVERFRADWKYDPGFFASSTYINGAVFEAAVQAVKGKVEDKKAFMAALRATNIQTCRGPTRFDAYGNAVGDVHIRRAERKDGRLVNAIIHTYPNVSQFWTYDQAEFLKNPVYSREWPPAKNLEV
jgi:branched-chain amino acid transport system substrate-binding protein